MVPFGDVAHHGEADAGPLDASPAARLAAHELPEDRLLFITRNTRAPVAHADAHPALLAADVDDDARRLTRVLHRVLEKVPDRTREGIGIGGDHRTVGRGAALDREAAGGRLPLEVADHSAHQNGRIQRLEPIRARARLHPAEIEQRFDEPPQPLDAAHLRFIVGAPLVRGRFVLVAQQRRELVERRQRRPKLVRDGRHEVGLQTRHGELARQRPAGHVAASRDGEHEQ